MEYLIKILTGSLSPLLLTPDVSTSSAPPPSATHTHSAASDLPPSSLPSASSENINQLCSTTDATRFSYSRLFSCSNSMSAFPWQIVSRYLIKLGCNAVCWRVWIGLVQEGLDRGQDGGHVVCGGPAVLEDVQAYAPVSVYIRVEHFTHKPEERMRQK